uniref:Domain of unknown function at the cortex 1 domain-containing protein n=1 Tax=Aplanochytrium stocchinoi TaxID=215587 RepID=A0A6S8E8Z1_9STRA|mmetsp:Transcript_17705/g.21535  ORF Transcript_17705/g.21535 Transcript_17705/m.21535 type:complete len:422 (+) Transcript_17705:361-1626(+)
MVKFFRVGSCFSLSIKKFKRDNERENNKYSHRGRQKSSYKVDADHEQAHDEYEEYEDHDNQAGESREIFYSVDEGPYESYRDSHINNKNRHGTEDTLVYDSDTTASTSHGGEIELALGDGIGKQNRKQSYDEATFKKVDALPELSEWDGPVWIRMDTRTRLEGKQWRTDGGSEAKLEYNEPVEQNVFHFETDTFKGKAIIRFRNCPNEPTQYFKGRRRKQQWTVQGRFKENLRTNQVVTGYEFKRKVVNIPAKWIVRSALSVVRTLAPTMKEDIFSDEPYFLNPLLQTVQTLDVSWPGKEPDITKEFSENNSLLGGKFSKHNISRTSRKHYFASGNNGKKHFFDPELLYTFDFYEDKFDPSSFKLVLPFMSFDVCKYLDSQPISMIGKVWDNDSEVDGSYLFNFSVFHKSQYATRKALMKT